MLSFVLIAGVWINLVNVNYFEPSRGDKCLISFGKASTWIHIRDPNCEQLTKVIQEMKK